MTRSKMVTTGAIRSMERKASARFADYPIVRPLPRIGYHNRRVFDLKSSCRDAVLRSGNALADRREGNVLKPLIGSRRGGSARHFDKAPIRRSRWRIDTVIRRIKSYGDAARAVATGEFSGIRSATDQARSRTDTTVATPICPPILRRYGCNSHPSWVR